MLPGLLLVCLLLGLASLQASSPPDKQPAEVARILLSRTLRVYREAGPGRTVVLTIDEEDNVKTTVADFCASHTISAPRCRYLQDSTAAEAAEKRPFGRIIMAFNTLIAFQDGSRHLRRFTLHEKQSPGEAGTAFCQGFGVGVDECGPLHAYLAARATAGQGSSMHSVAFQHGHRVYRVELREGDRAHDRVNTVCRILLLPDSSCDNILKALTQATHRAPRLASSLCACMHHPWAPLPCLPAAVGTLRIMLSESILTARV